MTPSAVIEQAFKDGIRPIEVLTVSEWADQYGFLPKECAKEAGPWRTSRVPFLRKIMDSLGPASPVQQVIVMKGTQLGFTTVGIMWLGYTIAVDPAPMLSVMPTLETAKRHSKTRIAPTIKAIPCLDERVDDPRERDSGNTTLYKEFPGGYVVISGANSASSLRSLPAKKLMLDEIDKYEADLEGEGDTCSVAEKRCDTYGSDKKIYKLSTPTIKGISAIEAQFTESDQQYYYVPCPYCGHKQILVWEQIKFVHDEYRLKGAVTYECIGCHEHIHEFHKTEMLEKGQWKAHNPGHEHQGYHLSSLYSPLGWLSWKDIVKEFLTAKKTKDSALLKAWVNNRLAQVWDDEAQPHIDTANLHSRRESYGPSVPMAALVLTAAVDVQSAPARLEIEIKAHAPNEESFTMDYHTIHGDPGQRETWENLAAYLWQTERYHQSGAPMKIALTLIDTGGHFTQQTYDFCRRYRKQRAFGTKGSQFPGKPIFERAGRKKGSQQGKVDFFIGTDTAKDTVFSRIASAANKVVEPELYMPLTAFPVETYPYYMHFNMTCDEEFFAQLVAERPEKVKVGRRFVRKYVQIRDRNEALDLNVLNLAAIRILKPNWKALVERLAAATKRVQDSEGPRATEEPGGQGSEAPRVTASTPEPENPRTPDLQPKPQTPNPAPRRRVINRGQGGWINAWR